MEKRNLSILWLVLILIGWFSPLSGLHPEKSISQYSLEQLKAYQDLPTHNILAITQSDDGYIWLGGLTGLICVGGDSIQNYPTYHFTGKLTLKDWITATVRDDRGNIWFCGGPGVLHYKNGYIRLIIPVEKLSDTAALSLCLDRDGNLWIGTIGNFLYRYTNGTLTHYNQTSGLTAPVVRAIREDRNGLLWLATSPGGLFYGKGGKFQRFPLPEGISLYALIADRQGNFWAGSDRGLVVITNPLSQENRNVRLYTTQDGLSSDIIMSLLQDSDNNIWCGSTQGLNRIKVSKEGQVSIEADLMQFSIDSLFEDKEKSLWVGTTYSGLVRLRDIPFRAGPISPSSRLYKDPTGRIWLGNNLGQLFLFEKDKPRLISKNPPQLSMAITSMLIDTEGIFWVGTQSQGVFQFNEKSNMLVSVYPPTKKIGEGRFFSIYAMGLDSNKRVLFCTLGGGLHYYQNGRYGSYTTHDGLPTDVIFDFYEDNLNNLWLATLIGLIKVEKGIWSPQTISHFLKGLVIHAIQGDKNNDHTLWLASNEQGLIRFKNNRAYAFNLSNGMSSNKVKQVYEDWREDFWLATGSGVMQISKKELNDFADTHSSGDADNFKDLFDERNRFRSPDPANLLNPRVFHISDGFRVPICTPSARNSIIRANDDELWFCSLAGVEMININQLRQLEQPSPLHIEHIFFNGEEIPKEIFQKEEKRFRGISSIRFQFSAVTFFSQRKLLMLYKLENFEDTWHEITPFDPKEVAYRDLPFGSYRFRVIATNRGGIWNTEGISLPFILAPYFYQTLWFKITAIIVLLAVVMASYLGLRHYYYLRNLKLKYQNSTLDPEKAELTLKKLEFLMEVKHVYREDSLSLNTLAEKLKITPHYLSQVLNERCNKNFWEFLNGYRIEEVKKKLLENNEKTSFTIIDLAFQAGFNSKEAFNRAFKKFTGKTPTEYKKTEAQ